MSSKRRQRRKACTGKKKHVDQAGAWGQINQLKRAGKMDPFTRPYKCPFCKGWHVGHEPKKAREGRERAGR